MQNYPGGYLGGFGFGTVGIYLYEDIYYRQWITEIALAFYEGRQDEFVWLDLLKQFRNPEKQQIIPLNLTREIVDETSILYREPPIYRIRSVKDRSISLEDQALWEQIQEKSRYHAIMNQVDRLARLLGTVLVKVAFIDENTGETVKSTEGGVVQLDVLHGGVYDVKYTDSPYFISELLINFGYGTANQSSKGWAGTGTTGLGSMAIGGQSQYNPVSSVGSLGGVSNILWSPDTHSIVDEEGQIYEGTNPYGIIPAVPFFNQEPAHYFFLPIDEPLIYANHTINMRITALNHIAKFQSFGIPVMTGVERGTSIRRGRPIDDMNVLQGAGAGNRFRGIGGFAGFAQGNQFRSRDSLFGFFQDGNAEANAVGMSIGPDTAIAMGEKGDFKFAIPNADLAGLTKVIENISDWTRVNHGLRSKFKGEESKDGPSGFAKLMDKLGVIENNIHRQRLFREREQQLFQTIKKLWNKHHENDKGVHKFSEDCYLDVTYLDPKFPLDPDTEMRTAVQEHKLIETGDKRAIKTHFKHMTDTEISELIDKHQEDRKKQLGRELDLKLIEQEFSQKHGLILENGTLQETASSAKVFDMQTDPKIDNRAEHARQSSKQPGKGDFREPAKASKKTKGEVLDSMDKGRIK